MPDFILVEPVMTSAPVSAQIETKADYTDENIEKEMEENTPERGNKPVLFANKAFSASHHHRYTFTNKRKKSHTITTETE